MRQLGLAYCSITQRDRISLPQSPHWQPGLRCAIESHADTARRQAGVPGRTWLCRHIEPVTRRRRNLIATNVVQGSTLAALDYYSLSPRPNDGHGEADLQWSFTQPCSFFLAVEAKLWSLNPSADRTITRNRQFCGRMQETRTHFMITQVLIHLLCPGLLFTKGGREHC